MKTRNTGILRYILHEYGEPILAVLTLPFLLPAAALNRRLRAIPDDRVPQTKRLLLTSLTCLALVPGFSFLSLLAHRPENMSNGTRALAAIFLLWLALGILSFASLIKDGNWQIRNKDNDASNNRLERTGVPPAAQP